MCRAKYEKLSGTGRKLYGMSANICFSNEMNKCNARPWTKLAGGSAFICCQFNEVVFAVLIRLVGRVKGQCVC